MLIKSPPAEVSRHVNVLLNILAGVWKYLFELLADYKTLYGDISLTVGTAYDYNNDALWEGTISETR